jgi:hypothetical protein
MNYVPEKPEHVSIDLHDVSSSSPSALEVCLCRRPRRIQSSETFQFNNCLTCFVFFCFVFKSKDDDVPLMTTWGALMIPNVIGYSIAFGFFKLVNYTL